MAYGKDASRLDQTKSFRQQNRFLQSNKPQRANKSFLRFVDCFAPQLNKNDWVRLIRGGYKTEIATQNGELQQVTLDYFPFVDHFHATIQRGTICSAGPLHAFKDLRDPCLGCDIFWAGRESGSKGPMGKRQMCGFTLIHKHLYARVESMDKEGKVRKNQKGEPYMEWVAVLPHERAKFEGRETRNWNLMHMALGTGHFGSLDAYAREVRQTCLNCKTIGSITTWDLKCAECGTLVMADTTSNIAPEDLEKLLNDICRCPHCGYKGYLQEIPHCEACNNPRPADIYDVDIRITKEPPLEGNATRLVCREHAIVPIDPLIEPHIKPLDLKAIYAPDTLEKQAEQYRLGSGWRTNMGGQLRQEGEPTPSAVDHTYQPQQTPQYRQYKSSQADPPMVAQQELYTPSPAAVHGAPSTAGAVPFAYTAPTPQTQKAPSVAPPKFVNPFSKLQAQFAKK